MAGRTFLASWQLSASRSHACAIWDKTTRASRSPNVRAISKHCCARRRYSSALLATILQPVRTLDDKRGRRGLVRTRASSSAAKSSPALARALDAFCVPSVSPKAIRRGAGTSGRPSFCRHSGGQGGVNRPNERSVLRQEICRS